MPFPAVIQLTSPSWISTSNNRYLIVESPVYGCLRACKGLDHPSRDLRQHASDGEPAKVVLMRFENEVDDQMAPRGDMVARNGPTRLSGTAVVFFTARTTILLSMLETSPSERIRSRRKWSKVCMSRVTMRNS